MDAVGPWVKKSKEEVEDKSVAPVVPAWAVKEEEAVGVVDWVPLERDATRVVRGWFDEGLGVNSGDG